MHPVVMKPYSWIVLPMLALAAFPHGAGAGIVVLAKTGDPAPDGNGTLRLFTLPALSDPGEVVFAGSLADAVGTNEIVAVARAGQPLVQVARRAGFSPLGFPYDSLYGASLAAPAISPSGGLVAFHGELSGTPGGGSDNDLVFGWSSGGAVGLFREGDPAFGGGTYTPAYTKRPTVNRSGQVAAAVTMDGNPEQSAIYRFNPSASPDPLQEVVRGGESVGGSGVLNVSGFETPVMNDSGTIAFLAEIDGSGVISDSGIFTSDGSTLTKIVRKGDPVPGGTTFAGFGPPAMNQAGDVAFYGFWSDGGSKFGVFRKGAGGIIAIGRSGDPLAGGETIGHLGNSPVVSDNGTVVFTANTSAYPNSGGAKHALFVGSGGMPEMVAGLGMMTPDGGGEFRPFSHSSNPIAVNASGDVAFVASMLVNGAVLDGLLRFRAGQGLEEIIRKGDAFLGSTVSGLGLSGVTAVGTQVADCHTGINNQGAVAFWFALEDGRSGIAIWEVDPPPSPVYDIEVTRDASDVTLEWSGPDTYTYRVVYGASPAGPWMLSPELPVQYDPGKWRWQDMNTPHPAKRFYRIAIE